MEPLLSDKEVWTCKHGPGFDDLEERSKSGTSCVLVTVQCGHAGATLEPWRDLREALIKIGN